VLDGCRVEAVVNVDARGQMVLPKELREKAQIGPDQKLAVLSWSRDGELCCITLQRADDVAEVVRRTYGPLLSAGLVVR
jgi:antitoxin PrlF